MSVEHVVLGTGPIGRAVAEELLRQSKRVRMVNRSGGMAEAPQGAEVVAADVRDAQAVREVSKGAQVVYQSAQPAYTRWLQEFPPLQQAILEGLTGGSAKLVIVDNLYMYGPTHGAAMTEDTPCRAVSRKGQVRGQMAQAALAAHRAGKVRVALARGSDYFGPWGVSSAMGERAIYPLLEGKAAQMVGRLDVPHSFTFVGDFARALVILGERQDADGQAWHVPNDNPCVTQGEMVKMFAEAAGVKPKMSSMGRTMLWIGGLFIPEARESLEMMYEFEEPFEVDSGRFERTFGMKATPLREAAEATVAWYRAHPRGR